MTMRVDSSTTHLTPLPSEGADLLAVPPESRLRVRLQSSRQTLVGWVDEHPGTALVLAACAGVAVGRLGRLLFERIRDR